MEAFTRKKPADDGLIRLISGRWVLANLFGWVIGGLLGVLTSRGMGDLSLRMRDVCASMAAAVFVIGIVLGFTQWLALRAVFKGSGVWIAATAVGLCLGYCIGFRLIDRMALPCHPIEILPWVAESKFSASPENFLSWGTEFFIYGLALGLAQYVVLRNWVRSSGLWVIATALSFTLAFPIGNLITEWIFTRQTTTLVTQSATTVTGGLIFGIGTGVMLLLLLRRPRVPTLG